ncbi:endogenous retrovirus group FC1 Env polyprotein [Ursus americanus]|uniref:endogenous retrovirus group FC1 Env polyprotein n=1 Tax=Ursus americanus TaxID=9643 RepID=UPI001E67B5ED|nr:endogenous retrovirus group FC1 Env polyprotein [Ursus americanus]
MAVERSNDWEVDFTEVRPGRYGNKYLLVFIDTFSGWVEAYPTKTETAQIVTKKLIEEIFPRFGVPRIIGSDNGPAFVAQVSQDIARILGVNWKLHCAYRPQSSGQVERINRTIKETITKLSLETGVADWIALLPYALFRVRNTPNFLNVTPFEILYGTTPPLASIHENVTSKYLVPLGGWWACNTGLTPCLHTSIFNQSADFCIMIQLLPKVTYYETAPFEDRFDSYRQGGSLIGDRHKRELISISLAVLLGLGVAAGIGTGAAALVQGSQSYQELRMSTDEDLKVLEQSITHLEKSLTSLSEVVLQNRRGLDLLFLQQGGVCVALNEECCFYSDHSGVIKDSMTKLRQRLVERRKEREASQGWFQGWFNKTPWLTTLISALTGPLLIILLLLTLGPCVLNRLIQFVRSQVSTVQLFMLRHEYQELNPSEDPTIP